MNDYIGIDLGAYQVRIHSSSAINDKHEFLSWLATLPNQEVLIDQTEQGYKDVLNKGYSLEHNFFKHLYPQFTGEFNQKAFDTTRQIFEKILDLNPAVAQTQHLLIAVPSYLNQEQQDAVLDVAKRLGVNHAKTIPQGLAKAIFLAHKYSLKTNDSFAILDWSASQFEYSIFRVSAQQQVEKIISYSMLDVGSYQCDTILWQMVADKYQVQRNKTLELKDFHYLDPQIRGVQQGFNDHDERAVNIWDEFTFDIKKDEYIQKIQILIQPIFNHVNQILDEHHVKNIYLTGGMTQIQIFKDILTQHIKHSIVDVYIYDMAARGAFFHIQQLDAQRKKQESQHLAEYSVSKLDVASNSGNQRRIDAENKIKDEIERRATLSVEIHTDADDYPSPLPPAEYFSGLEETPVSQIVQVQDTWNIFEFLFTASGRVSRGQYFAYCIGQFVITMILFYINNTLGIMFSILSLYPTFILSIKRSHDMDFTGHFVWLVIIPYINIIALLMLVFKKGTKGDNKYGYDPLQQRQHVNLAWFEVNEDLQPKAQQEVAEKQIAREAKELQYRESLKMNSFDKKAIILGVIGILLMLMFVPYKFDAMSAEKVASSSSVDMEALEPPSPVESPVETPEPPVEEPATAATANELTVNAPDLTEGTRWNIKTVDLRRPQDSYDNVEFKVTGVFDDSYQIEKIVKGRNNTTTELIYDRSLNLYRGATGIYSPTLAYYDFPLYTGKTWRTTSNISNNAAKDSQLAEGEVLGWETISSPYWQDIHTLKVMVEFTSYKHGQQVHRGLDVSWYDPDMGRAIKTEEYAWDNSSDSWQKARTHYVFDYVKY